MRKALILSAIALLGVLVTVALAQISGTAHDFSGDTWNTSGEICIVCHTPHNADTSVSAAPLWNHDVTTATYTLYSSSTLDATLGQPGDISKLCLSCHDGTVAIDSFGGATGSNFISGG
ncbi:MAG: cytochrome C, partial [Candidatus Aminicenantales bacterium]